MTTHDHPAGSIRKLWPNEVDIFHEHLLRLDAESLRNRFAMSVSSEFLADYAARCFTLGTVVYGYFEAGVLRAAAELRPLTVLGTADGEVAFSVEPTWRSRGIGGALFARLLVAARNRGYRKLHMNCLAWNRPMQALARKFRADLHFEAGDIIGTIIADTDEAMPPRADEDSPAFATAVVDL